MKRPNGKTIVYHWPGTGVDYTPTLSVAYGDISSERLVGRHIAASVNRSDRLTLVYY